MINHLRAKIQSGREKRRLSRERSRIENAMRKQKSRSWIAYRTNPERPHEPYKSGGSFCVRARNVFRFLVLADVRALPDDSFMKTRYFQIAVVVVLCAWCLFVGCHLYNLANAM